MFRTTLISMFLTSTALADTWTVDDDGKADFDNIQAAVDAASDGDEIIVMPGTYFQDPKNLILLKNKPLWLHSSDGPEATIIDCLGKCRAIDGWGEAGTTLIEGFTIKNGSAGNSWDQGGGGLRWMGDEGGDEELILRDCIFESNESDHTGGGALISNTVITIEDCVFSNNAAIVDGSSQTGGYGGGVVIYESTATIRNTNFIHNEASGNGRTAGGGGLLSWDGQLTLMDCIFDSNSTDCWGGGLCNLENILFAEGCDFINNRGSFGGALYNQAQKQAGNYYATLTNCTFEDNFADLSNNWGSPSKGAGILLNYSSQAYVNNCTFTNNSARCSLSSSRSAGGGIACWRQSSSPEYKIGLTVTDCIFDSNPSERGGGIWIQSFGEPIIRDDQLLIQVQLNQNSLERSSVSRALGGGKETGACCLEGDCQYWTEEVCLLYEGAYLGDGSSCGDINCYLVGACCVTDEPCMSVLEDECNSAGGIWQGELTSCFTTNCSGLVLISGTDFYCNLPTDIDGDYTDNGGNTFADDCPNACVDINCTGDVNVTDLLAVIDQWGSTGSPADVNADGIVDVTDLLIVVGNWGEC